MSKNRIPSAFDTTLHNTEWTCAAKLGGWMNEIITEKRLELGIANVEQKQKHRAQRSDVIIADPDDPKKALCVIEFKQPIYDPFDRENLKDPAWKKARDLHAKYFCTSNFQRMIWYNTQKVSENVSEVEQIHEQYHLAEIEDLDTIDEPRFQNSIRKGLEKFLERLHNVHTGKQAAPQKAIDELLVLVLHEKVNRLARFYREIINEKYHKDDTFKDDLVNWFHRQKWDFFPDDRYFEKAARQAAYLLVNKIMFYDALQSQRQYNLPRLEIPESLVQGGILQGVLQSYFSHVIKAIDYEQIYDTDFIDHTAFPDHKGVVTQIKELIKILDGFDFATLGYEILGRIFEKLIPENERHLLGQYFTNPDVVDIILGFCVRHEDDLILDPSCGAGTFLVRAYVHKKMMNQIKNHNDILRTLWGTDIAKFPVHLAIINLAINDLRSGEAYPRIIHKDFFDLMPGHIEVPESWRRIELRGLGKDTKKELVPRFFDCIVGNPPYTRQEEITAIGEGQEKYKTSIADHALKDRGKVIAKLSKRAGIYAYFFIHGAKFLKDGGRFGFVVSNSWLDVDYGKGLQEFFLRNFKIVAIIESKVERWFEDADINTCIVLLEKCTDLQQRNDNIVRFVYLFKPLRHFIPPAQDNWETLISRFDEIDKLMKTILSHNEFYQNDDLRIYPKKQSELWDEGLELVDDETSPSFSLSPHVERGTGGEVTFPKVPGYIYEIARKLRKEQTPAEKILWECLRARRLNGLKFRRQHPLGRYIPDFYCAEKRLVVELEGKVHELKDQKEYDKIRQETIEAMGLTVLRFKNEEVFNNLELVLAKITSPPSSPSPKLERGMGGEVVRYVGSKWGKYLRAPEIFFTILEKGKDKLVPLKEIAKVRFGIKTGANEFFYLTEEEIKERGIEKEFWMHKEDGKWVPNYIIKSPRECESIMLNPGYCQVAVLKF